MLSKTKTARHFIVVLGCAILNQNEPSPDLQARLDKAIQLYSQNPNKPSIINSGLGHQQVPEADVMHSYIQRNTSHLPNLPSLHKEAYSLNTPENAFFSMHLIHKLYGSLNDCDKIRLTIVTSDYHAQRSKIIFQKTLERLKGLYPLMSLSELDVVGASSKKPPGFRESQQLFKAVDSMVERLFSLNFNLRIFRSMRGINEAEMEGLLEFVGKDRNILKKTNWD